MLFNAPDNHQNCPFPLRMWTPSNIWFLGPTRVIHRNVSPSFQPFCRANECDQQTDRHADKQTDRPRYSVCSNRPHLAIAAKRPNSNKWSKNFDERPIAGEWGLIFTVKYLYQRSRSFENYHMERPVNRHIQPTYFVRGLQNSRQ